MDISIIIPTYKRRGFLQVAIESILKQNRLPSEIIIGDDSPDNETDIWVEQSRASWPFAVKYIHNKSSLGQAKNVDWLINAASGDYILLLHDDDILMPNALMSLCKEVEDDSTNQVVFGKQYPMSNDGDIFYEKGEAFNASFCRTTEYAGISLNPYLVTFRRQLPSNGFLVNTNLAKRVGYGAEQEAGTAVDFHFSLKLSAQKANFKFVDTYVSCYRNSVEAVSKSAGDNAGLYSFMLVQSLKIPDVEGCKLSREVFLEQVAPTAIKQAVEMGDIKKAIAIYFSKYHFKEIFSLGGLNRAFGLVRGLIVLVSTRVVELRRV